MKKIILSHNNLNVIKESLDYLKSNKLPNYVYKSVKSHNTSLGDCPSFPPSHDYDFDYKVLKKGTMKSLTKWQRLVFQNQSTNPKPFCQN